jgi:hypothetical protein
MQSPMSSSETGPADGMKWTAGGFGVAAVGLTLAGVTGSSLLRLALFAPALLILGVMPYLPTSVQLT